MSDEVRTVSKYSTLLTDIGGVCISNPYIFVAEYIENNYGIDAGHAYQVMKLNAREFDAGKISFRVFAEITLRSIGVDMDPGRFSAVHDRGLREKTDVISLYRKVKKQNNVRIVALSNMPEYTWKLIRGFKWMGDLFDFTVLSYQHMMLKPDRRLFDVALQTAGTSSARCLFVDDAIENVEAANNIGILSHLYSSTEKLRGFLEHNGLICDTKSC
ncbi:MAG: HAD-IA family hydrolase [Candidatus Thermoplasmatota archaeon]|nr:HAD-IA family hydrolase [Candidatus Thermoplasmatota archaeon]